MAMHLNEDDHILLDRYLTAVLWRHGKDGNLTEARLELAQVIGMIALDNESFRHHMAGAITQIGEPT